jgi:hypothetical protein
MALARSLIPVRIGHLFGASSSSKRKFGNFPLDRREIGSVANEEPFLRVDVCLAQIDPRRLKDGQDPTEQTTTDHQIDGGW